jgi:hypothetical protein
MWPLLGYISVCTLLHPSSSFLQLVHRRPSSVRTPHADLITLSVRSMSTDLLGNTLSETDVMQELEDSGSNDYSTPLIKDIDMLCDILGDVIKKENPDIYEVTTGYIVLTNICVSVTVSSAI